MNNKIVQNAIYVAIVLVFVTFIYLGMNSGSKSNTDSDVNKNYELNKESTQDLRRKQRYDLQDKYEDLIKQNKRNFASTLELITNDGFRMEKSEAFPGGAKMYHYIRYVDGFEIVISYLDSPNSSYKEFVLTHIKDLQ